MTSEAVFRTQRAKRINFRRNYYLLLAGRLISNLGTSMFNFATSLYVLDITNSAGAFAAILALGFVPGIFVNILGGVYVDKSDKKRLIILAELLSAEAVFAFTYIVHYDPKNILVFVAYVLVVNTFQSLFGLTMQAAIPNIVSEENVGVANATLQGIGSFINIVGPMFGALLYGAVGLETVFILNGLSFVLSGGLAFFMRLKAGVENRLVEEGENFLSNFKETFKFLKSRDVIRFFMIFGIIVNTIYTPLIMMVVRYINFNILQASEIQISIIQAIESTGIILAAFYITIQRSNIKLMRKFFKLLIGQSILVTLWVFPMLPLFKGAPQFVLTGVFSAILFLIALLNTLQNIPLFTHFQVQIPEEIRGRVFGVFNTALIASTPLGMWLFGYMLDKFHWGYVPLAGGLFMVITCIVGSRNKAYKEFMNNFYY